MTASDTSIDERQDRTSNPKSPTLSLRLTIMLMGCVLAAVLAIPGTTITTKYVNDLFIFLDGAYRITAGQVPNVDFHTSLGPLAFYLPAFGLGMTGRMGSAMPVGMALVVLALSLIAAEVLASRMRRVIAIPLGLFLLLGVAAPANTGEGVGELSFAMFYNRLGWASLGLLLVMYLPRRDGERRDVLDAICATALVLLMLYLKITYGLAELAFLVFMLLDRRQWRWAITSLGFTVISVLVIESLWGGSLNHLQDLRLASDVSGGVPTLRTLIEVVLRNLPDVAVYSIFAVLLLLRRRMRDLAFIGFCAGGGVLIIEQNFQTLGIVTLGAGAAVIAEVLTTSRLSARQSTLARGLSLLLVLLLLPPTATNASNLLMHAYYGFSGNGDEVPLPAFKDIRLVPMWSQNQYDMFRRYNASLEDGARALASLGAPERVAVLDFVNPFSAGMGLPPPAGDSAWYHWGRTLDREHHPRAEEYFADVELILDPKAPIEAWTANGMRDIYASYIRDNFELATETEFWRIYRRGS